MCDGRPRMKGRCMPLGNTKFINFFFRYNLRGIYRDPERVRKAFPRRHKGRREAIATEQRSSTFAVTIKVRLLSQLLATC